MPNYISVEVKDLISRMLQPNPIIRMTIKEIKLHVWYKQELPDYLVELSNISMLSADPDIDMDLVKELIKVGHDQNTIEDMNKFL